MDHLNDGPQAEHADRSIDIEAVLREEVVPLLEQLRSEGRNVRREIREVKDHIRRGAMAAGPTSHLGVGLDIGPSTPVNNPATETVTIPAPGTLDSMLVGWPGINGAVGIRVERVDEDDDDESDVFLPRNVGDRFTAFPTATVKRLDLNQEVERGDVIRGTYTNTDPNNNHLATVLLSHEEEEV